MLLMWDKGQYIKSLAQDVEKSCILFYRRIAKIMRIDQDCGYAVKRLETAADRVDNICQDM